ncbi:MAG: Rieske (2Fe-2S) protein [Planctomycetaceae bacterium]
MEVALFRIDGTIHVIDNMCPHEGGSLAEGTLTGDVVTCPLHGWTFNACSGCSLDPPGSGVRRYETLVEAGNVFVRVPEPAVAT